MRNEQKPSINLKAKCIHSAAHSGYGSLYSTATAVIIGNIAAACLSWFREVLMWHGPYLLKLFKTWHSTAGVALPVTYLLQFAEIIFIIYEQDYKLAGLLAFVTISSCFISVYKLYQSRMGLYQSVSQQRLVAIVQAGRVR